MPAQARGSFLQRRKLCGFRERSPQERTPFILRYSARHKPNPATYGIYGQNFLKSSATAEMDWPNIIYDYVTTCKV